MTPKDVTPRTPTPYLAALVDHIPDQWDHSQYMLVGSACMAVRGIRDVHDLDVFVHPDLWAAVQDAFNVYRDVVKHAVYTDALSEGVFAEAAQAANAPEVHVRQILLTTLGIDFFTELPRVAACVPFADCFKQGQDYQINGRTHRVISMRHALAIKALANRAKDLEDMVLLSTRILVEEQEEAEQRAKDWASGEIP